ncbi:hypothetical protein SAY86_013587 [Trapa natans]|uniref:Uncharacterized protein n=1 Tax=Trapa natans TaxID=22666 RepID=A0AAN7QLT3_TRANT|nr:hypothetical protein SAY86_013587 [Trapa natans]
MYNFYTIKALRVYDITRRETYKQSPNQLVRGCKAACKCQMTIMLIGNKCGIAHRRAVSTEEGEQFAIEHGLIFMEASAKIAQNMEEMKLEMEHSRDLDLLLQHPGMVEWLIKSIFSWTLPDHINLLKRGIYGPHYDVTLHYVPCFTTCTQN